MKTFIQSLKKPAFHLWIVFTAGVIAIMLIPSIYHERQTMVDFFVPAATDTVSSSRVTGNISQETISASDVIKNTITVKDRYHNIVAEASERYGVESCLVKAVIMAESSYNPRAVSRRGARGLMQLMPRTAESLGVENIFDPVSNINAGVKYLKKLLDYFDNDAVLALAAYNAGITKVRKYDGVPPFRATRAYIDKVFRYRDHYRARMSIGDHRSEKV